MPPQPRLPGPIPTPSQDGHLGWGSPGGGGRCSRVTRPEHRDPSHPIHLSPNWPPPRLALGKTFPTTPPPRPPGLGQSHRPGLGLHLICSQPGPPGPLLVPQAWPASPQPLQKLDFPPKPAQGAWQTHSTIKRKTLPHQAPSHCPEAFENPWSVRLSPGAPSTG